MDIYKSCRISNNKWINFLFIYINNIECFYQTPFNPLIFLLSDQGVGLESIYYTWFKFIGLEADLPMLYIIINDLKNVKYQEQYFHIHKNHITGYGIYNKYYYY